MKVSPVLFALAVLAAGTSIHWEVGAATISAGSLVAGQEKVQVSYSVAEATQVTIAAFDAQGNRVKVIFAKVQKPGDYAASWDGTDAGGSPLPAGGYTIRLQFGGKPVLDASFAAGGILKRDEFTSPMKIALDEEGKIYLLDRGEKFLFKFNPDGTAATDFQGDFKFAIPEGSTSATVDEGGNIYVGRTSWHDVPCYDRQGRQRYVIGGWDDKPSVPGAPCTPYPEYIALGEGSKIYISSHGYTLEPSAYDRTKAGFEGFLYRSNENTGLYFCALARSGQDIFYGIRWNGGPAIYRITDTGGGFEMKAVVAGIGTTPGQLQEPVNAFCDGKGAVWVADRATSRVSRFFDSGGEAMSFISSFGQLGDDLAQGQFRGLRDCALTPDGKQLYVLEDGEKFGEQEWGCARLSRFNLPLVEEFEVQLREGS